MIDQAFLRDFFGMGQARKIATHLACENCRFWAKTHYAMGECKRHAPVFHNTPPQHPNGDVPQRRFPRTLGRDGCGDFEPPAPTAAGSQE
jgi:hypothetical protein